MSTIWTFNMKDGYADGILRGLRQGLLTPEDYRKLGLANSLEDLKTVLEETDYGSFLQQEALPLTSAVIGMKAKQKFADEFLYLRRTANYPLRKFLDFIATEKMIDNVVNLLGAVGKGKSSEELVACLDPLGWFPELNALLSYDVSHGYEEFYRMILVDTPVGVYFESYLNNYTSPKEEDGEEIPLDERDLELMRCALKKDWLEDFYAFCMKLGGNTEKIVGEILMREADLRVLAVTMNTLNRQNKVGTNARLYPRLGYLYPEGTYKLANAWNEETVLEALQPYPKYLRLFEQCREYYMKNEVKSSGINSEEASFKQDSETKQSDEKKYQRNQLSVEDLFFSELVKLSETAFEEQFHYGVFYALVRLKEQEIRNIIWIADMILINRKDQISKIVPIFEDVPLKT